MKDFLFMFKKLLKRQKRSLLILHRKNLKRSMTEYFNWNYFPIFFLQFIGLLFIRIQGIAIFKKNILRYWK